MRPWFADIVVNGIAGLSVCLVVYLFRTLCQDSEQKSKQREQRNERDRQRQDYWGFQ
jgi:hypothetical protein